MDNFKQMLPEQIHGTIESVLQGRLGQVRLDSVDVDEDYDHDGDAILNVTVVYEPDGGELDAARIPELLVLLRRALSERGEFRFPVTSFITRKDRLEAV